MYTQADGRVYIHPKSVNAEEREFNYKWLIYHLKMRTSSVSRESCFILPDCCLRRRLMVGRAVTYTLPRMNI